MPGCVPKLAHFTNVDHGIPVVGQWVMNLASIHEYAGLIPGLTQWVKDPALPDLGAGTEKKKKKKKRHQHLHLLVFKKEQALL